LGQSLPRFDYHAAGDFTLFSLCLAAKYILVAAHDIKERFEWEIPLLLFSAFIAVLFVFLFSLDIGLLWLIVLMNIAFLIYYTKTEKKVFALFYILILVLRSSLTIRPPLCFHPPGRHR